MAYLALANSWGEVEGRAPPPPPVGQAPATSRSYSAGPRQQSPYLSERAYEQAVYAAEVIVEPIDVVVQNVMDEELLTAMEPGTAAHVDLAKVLFEIPEEEEESPVHTPTMVADAEEEEVEKSGTETEIEEGKSVDGDNAPFEPSIGYATEQSGAPLVEMAWPPPMLED